MLCSIQGFELSALVECECAHCEQRCLGHGGFGLGIEALRVVVDAMEPWRSWIDSLL